MKKPLILIIMDGFGLRDSDMGNAIHAAKHPNLTRLFHDYPTTQLGASGMDVGLPDGQMGTVRLATPTSAPVAWYIRS